MTLCRELGPGLRRPCAHPRAELETLPLMPVQNEKGERTYVLDIPLPDSLVTNYGKGHSLSAGTERPGGDHYGETEFAGAGV